LDLKPGRADVLSVFAGLRPLAAPSNDDTKKTKEISRNHKIYKSDSGLLTITGGKWTTYREMGEEAVNLAIQMGNLPEKKCVTKEMKVHGYAAKTDDSNWNYVYGSDAEKIEALKKEDKENAALLNPKYTFTVAHVIWAVREEMAQTLEDVLSRRVRALFLDARAAVEMAPKVASVMAKEMNQTDEWAEQQVKDFINLAKGYIL